MIEKNIIKPGTTPGIRELNKGGFSGFFPALAFREQKVNYNDLVQAVGMEPNIYQGRWNFIKYDYNGEVLTKEEKLEQATDYFSKNIYPNLVQKGIIKDGEPPTGIELIENNHLDFMNALRGKEPIVSFNHLIEFSGFEPKSPQDHNKWKMFHDQQNNPLPRPDQLRIATDYFKNEIIPDLLSKKVIDKNQTPDIHTLKEFGHYDFFKATNKRGILYDEIVINAGFIPNEANTLSAVGKDFHWIGEKIFLEHTRCQNNCKSFYEVGGNADNSIIIDDNFKKLSERAKNFVEANPNFKVINFDYFLSKSEGTISSHSSRGYQTVEKPLFLIPLNANEQQTSTEEVPYSDNVYVLNPENFANFMGYKDKLYNEFTENVRLARTAVYDEEAREILTEKKIEAVEIIKNNHNKLNHSTKDFYTSLRNREL